jgi:hypothetical protein
MQLLHVDGFDANPRSLGAKNHHGSVEMRVVVLILITKLSINIDALLTARYYPTNRYILVNWYRSGASFMLAVRWTAVHPSREKYDW